ncbi:MAG: DM13 domain-containing protein [Betaproteobacteria bacterium]|nr:DM13 domain-containing protein [Betaproteobacteria bacterium]
MKKTFFLAVTHLLTLAVGFALGIYALPILTAPPAPSAAEAAAQAGQAAYTGQFRRDLKDSDILHWGEGTLLVGRRSIALVGKIAPGPDYKLYLSTEFVETEADFLRLKPSMLRIGDVKTFENFVVRVPESVDVARYNAVIVWCEAFGQFITAARYR